jgi:hypothetical protein
MYPFLEGVTILMNGRSKCLSGLVFPPSKEGFQIRKQKEFTWARSGEYGGEAKQLLFLFSKMPKLLRRYERGHCHVEDGYALNQ